MMLKWLAAGGLAALLGTGSWLARRPPVEQPVAFNHEAHVKGEEMGCTDCHAADKSSRSGFGDIRSCNECHKDVQGDDPPSPAQEKVREFGKARREIPWVSVNRNAGHVYFSHRAHVTFGGMKCEECHGEVGSMKEPPKERVARLHSMDACMDCHRERGATLQCIACHD
jgi:menaquinone reductase, multiheme cytochrome c subunit